MVINANNKGIRTSPPTKSWRMIHNDIKVLHLFEAEGFTKTKQKLFVDETKEACITKAEELGLILLEEPKTV